MASKSKQNQILQTQVNDYEKSRLLRVKETKKIRELGVKSISDSFTSLVESQKLKKKIKKSSNINANDVDYIPAMGEDSKSDHEQLATRSKKVTKVARRFQVGTYSYLE
ncbi:hypothetical protein R6Q57_008959 [Mikania cordata]